MPIFNNKPMMVQATKKLSNAVDDFLLDLDDDDSWGEQSYESRMIRMALQPLSLFLRDRLLEDLENEK